MDHFKVCSTFPESRPELRRVSCTPNAQITIVSRTILKNYCTTKSRAEAICIFDSSASVSFHDCIKRRCCDHRISSRCKMFVTKHIYRNWLGHSIRSLSPSGAK